jgi:hypothetical protein
VQEAMQWRVTAVLAARGACHEIHVTEMFFRYWGFRILAAGLSANGDFTPSFCFVRFCTRFLKTKLQFAPIPLEGINSVKFVAKR